MPSWLNHKIMGNSRIHVATTYQVKYEFGDFSNKSEFINQLIAENCPFASFNEVPPAEEECPFRIEISRK